jgi:hypothetical protein
MTPSTNQHDFPLNPYLELLEGETTYKSTYKWVAVLAVNHPQYGPQVRYYTWILKNDRWTTHSHTVLNDRRYSDINLEEAEIIRKKLASKYI